VVWNFATNTWSKTLKVQVQTLAIEMVYVAGGAFWAGNTNAIINSSFHAQGNTNSPVYIASDDPFTIYWGPSDANSATISNAFPKGYNAFYCMKYEITQGQYTDFLNLLPASQAANRYSSASTGSGYTIGTNTMGAYTNGAADRACNFTSWADEAAFADWSGLRPMTELEFEKACRGPVMPVMNEYAWGSANIWKQTGHSGTVGSGTETALPANANCNGGGGIGTPVRVGIYATGSSSRESAGASYWGIMELSGNLWERLVSVGLAKGRTFTGLMGDGTLSASGDADVLNWPPSNGDGHGWRGAYWNTTVPSTVFCVSDRVNAALGSSWGSRYNESGFRGVRTASSGVGP
jgi:formylglycine-generating enzyme required for sulfatase activity